MESFIIPRGFYVQKIDEQTGVKYVGYAERGFETSDTRWVVQRATTVGPETTFEYAEGAWDDRTTLSYN